MNGEPWDVPLSEISQAPKDQRTEGQVLYDSTSVRDLPESHSGKTESRVVTRGWGRGEWREVVQWIQLRFCKTEKVLEMTLMVAQQTT